MAPAPSVTHSEPVADAIVTKRSRVALGTKVVRRHGALSPEDQRRADDNCPFGMPKLREDLAIPTKFVFRDGYVLEHSSVDRIPIWVSEHLTSAEIAGSLERSNRFRPDPLLPADARSELSDYRGSGFDRGHMAPAGNQNSDERLKDETFFLSNMSPQEGDLNRLAWAELEHQIREWAASHGEAYVITGGFFYDPLEDNPTTADGVINYQTIGENAVAVPTHFFKILVGKDSHGKPQAIAFFMEHRKQEKPYHFEKNVTSIRWLETQTGLDFMPDLDPATANAVESQPASYESFFGNN